MNTETHQDGNGFQGKIMAALQDGPCTFNILRQRTGGVCGGTLVKGLAALVQKGEVEKITPLKEGQGFVFKAAKTSKWNKKKRTEAAPCILKLLRRNKQPLTAADIVTLLKGAGMQIGHNTVRRRLNELVAKKKAQRTQKWHGKTATGYFIAIEAKTKGKPIKTATKPEPEAIQQKLPMATELKDQIVEALNAGDGTATYDELCRHFGGKRDLVFGAISELVHEGRVQVERSARVTPTPTPQEEKVNKLIEQKCLKIAKLLAKLVMAA